MYRHDLDRIRKPSAEILNCLRREQENGPITIHCLTENFKDGLNCIAVKQLYRLLGGTYPKDKIIDEDWDYRFIYFESKALKGVVTWARSEQPIKVRYCNSKGKVTKSIGDYNVNNSAEERVRLLMDIYAIAEAYQRKPRRPLRNLCLDRVKKLNHGNPRPENTKRRRHLESTLKTKPTRVKHPLAESPLNASSQDENHSPLDT